MENLNPWKLIKTGFLLGIGFVIPSTVAGIFVIILIYVLAPVFHSSHRNAEQAKSVAEEYSDDDKTEQIKILEYRESKNGNQLLILGKLENKGKKPISSIQLEAELFDDSAKIVYECSEYISKRLKPGETENFQIKCGGGNNPVPEYKSITVRTVKSSDYELCGD